MYYNKIYKLLTLGIILLGYFSSTLQAQMLSLEYGKAQIIDVQSEGVNVNIHLIAHPHSLNDIDYVSFDIMVNGNNHWNLDFQQVVNSLGWNNAHIGTYQLAYNKYRFIIQYSRYSSFNNVGGIGATIFFEDNTDNPTLGGSPPPLDSGGSYNGGGLVNEDELEQIFDGQIPYFTLPKKTTSGQRVAIGSTSSNSNSMQRVHNGIYIPDDYECGDEYCTDYSIVITNITLNSSTGNSSMTGYGDSSDDDCYIIVCEEGEDNGRIGQGILAKQTIEKEKHTNALNWKVYPNPAKEALWIDIPTLEKNSFIELYNINGSLIQTLPLSPNVRQFRLDTSELPGGLYLLHLRSGQEVQNLPVSIVN